MLKCKLRYNISFAWGILLVRRLNFVGTGKCLYLVTKFVEK